MHTRFDFEKRKRISNKFVIDNIISRFIKVYNDCDKCMAVNNAMKKVFKDYGYWYVYNGTDLKTSQDKEIMNDKEKFERVGKNAREMLRKVGMV